MYERVLVPTDGSPGSEQAVRHALDLAATYDADLYAVSVVEPEERRLPFGTREVRTRLVDRATAALEDVEDEARDWDVTLRTQVLEGHPHEQILRYVDQHDIDVVVMGTHGRQGLDRYLIGSVTERVVRSASVPVLAVSLGSEEHAVTTVEEARKIARDALEARGLDDVTLPEGAYNERSTWVVRAEADGRRFNVHIDKVSAEAHLVEIGAA